MTKMRMAKLDVVRFTESDVIVASRNMITVSGMGDGKANNLNIGYGENSYFAGSEEQMQAFYNAFNPVNHTNINGDTRIYFINGETSTELSMLETFDAQYTNFGNGSYIWKDGAFRYQ